MPVNIFMWCSPNNYDKRNIKLFMLQLRNKSSEICIGTLCKDKGGDIHIRKYALEMGYKLIDFNACNTPHSLYSYMPEHFYGKHFNFKSKYILENALAKWADMSIFFIDDTCKLPKSIVNLLNKKDPQSIAYIRM